MKKTINILFTAVLICFSILSCKKETNTPEENDNEVITTVEVHVTEQGASASQTFTWEDLEADGNPVIADIILAPDKIYNIEMVLLDKTKTPVENTTEEVKKENRNHRFYFEPSAGAGLTVSGFDNDDSGIPLGINSVWTTAGGATGTIKITLRHYPNGNKETADTVTSTKSSTDAEAVFTVRVQ